MSTNFKNKLINAIIALATMLFIFMVIVAAKSPSKETKLLVCNSPEHCVQLSDLYIKQGFVVKSITAESVSTSIKTTNGYGDPAYTTPYRDLRGKFILVMEKY